MENDLAQINHNTINLNHEENILYMTFKAKRKRVIKSWFESPTQKRWYPVLLKGLLYTKRGGEYGLLRIVLTESHVPKEVLEFNRARRVMVKLYIPNGEIRMFYCTLSQAPNKSWVLFVPVSQIDAGLYKVLKSGEYINAEIELAEPPLPPPT